MLLLLIGCFVVLIKGADFLVDGASDIAKALKIPSVIIGLTIVAFGTSLPELVTSITAAAKKETDIAIGNIVGSISTVSSEVVKNAPAVSALDLLQG